MQPKDLEEIESLVIEGAAQSFAGDDFRSMPLPGVYVLMLASECLYVGISGSVMGRIRSGRHHSWKAIKECDKVLLWPCISFDAALRLESILIQRLHPRYNKRGRLADLKKVMGIQQTPSVRCYEDHGDAIAIENWSRSDRQ
jgi:hypothetical protein